MRVIRTELYREFLDRPTARDAPNRGVGFAFLPTGAPLTEQSVGILLPGARFRQLDPHFAFDQLCAFLGAAARSFEKEDGVSDREVGAELLDVRIVIENSPPTHISLQSLLTKAPGIAIGSFIGMQAAGDLTPLMLITVPGGIIVVSSAIGISKALEKGLNKWVEEIIGR